MNITFVTTAKTDEEGRALLAAPRHAFQELRDAWHVHLNTRS